MPNSSSKGDRTCQRTTSLINKNHDCWINKRPLWNLTNLTYSQTFHSSPAPLEQRRWWWVLMRCSSGKRKYLTTSSALLESAPPRQTTLFDVAPSHCNSELIDPISLPVRSLSFYRVPADSPGDACLYFVVDSAAGLQQFSGNWTIDLGRLKR